jgi:hypothetical protein
MRRSFSCLLVAAAMAVPAVLSAAAPVMAVPLVCNPITTRDINGKVVSDIELNPDRYIEQLRDRGFDTDRVEDFNGCVRAYVKTRSGTEMMYFDPNSFAQLR